MQIERFSWFQENLSQFSGQLFLDEPLSKHTYFRIGGRASALIIPKGINDLNWISEGIRRTKIPFFILGFGSNVLVSDFGFDGLIIKTSQLNLEIKPDLKNITLRTGCSVAVSSLLRLASQEGWAGLEFLVGIPGSIGGVIAMNAGTHLGEAQSALIQVESYSFITSQISLLKGKALQFEYRKNLFLDPNSIFWSADWNIKKKPPLEVRNILKNFLERRKTTQPLHLPSCGSVFKNPSRELAAWQVLDQLHLRGYQIGKACFAEKHCNFILNCGGASAADVKCLIEHAKIRASTELGVELVEEVVYLGQF